MENHKKRCSQSTCLVMVCTGSALGQRQYSDAYLGGICCGQTMWCHMVQHLAQAKNLRKAYGMRPRCDLFCPDRTSECHNDIVGQSEAYVSDPGTYKRQE